LLDDASGDAEGAEGATASAWECAADAGERAAMRRRITDYLLRRTPNALNNEAQARYLSDVVVPSVEEALYRDAAGELRRRGGGASAARSVRSASFCGVFARGCSRLDSRPCHSLTPAARSTRLSARALQATSLRTWTRGHSRRA